MPRPLSSSLPMLVALVAGCAEEVPVDDPSFTAVREQVITPSCALSTCHAAASGYLDLDGTADDHGRLVGVGAFGASAETLVVPGDAAASYLVWKLEGLQGIEGGPMPPDGPLDDERIALVRAWIDAGALND